MGPPLLGVVAALTTHANGLAAKAPMLSRKALSMLRQGVHPKTVSECLGHGTVGIAVDTYSHVTPGLQEAAALRFEEGLREPVVANERQRKRGLKVNGGNFRGTKEMGSEMLPVSYLRWCRRPDSNRHGVLTPTVFETAASTVPPLRHVYLRPI